MKRSSEMEKSYFDVLGLCCSSEVSLIEKILKPLEGVHHVSVVVPSRTVIVVHDSVLVSQIQIVKVLNQARLEANVRVRGGDGSYRNKWPSPFAVICGVLLLLSFLKFVYAPFKWLALGAVAVGIVPLVLKSVASLRVFRLDINVLMLIAVGGSIFLKDYWEAGTIVFLLTTSEWLESRASHKATAVMSSLMNIAPQKAVLAETGEEVDANEVVVSTRLAVKAGEMIPIDGTVVEGRSEVDEKALTGESFPVSKQVDSTVWAGTINLNGYISVQTTALAEDCVVARMAKLVEEAQNKKSKTQRYIDKCAKYYTPAVVVVAACLAAIPAALRLHDRDGWYHLALVVLVSACPCALILSTPVASYCALSKAATIGLLVKGAEYLETLSTVKTIAFDKTGTITKGEFSVSNFRSLIQDVNLDRLLYWVSSIESKSSHPMAAALVDYAQSRSAEPPRPENVEEFENFPGEGIYGKIDGKHIYVGNRKIAVRAGCSTVPRNENESNEGKSTGYILLGSSLAGIFSLSDSCRIGVKEALKELKSMGIKTAMLTGDSQSAADHAQNQLGDALDVVHAELLPQDKAKMIKEFQTEASTAMVGDGLNDAPALATADVGISMGVSGSALANETGHVVLMSNDIRKIPMAVRLARRTRRKIFENISLAIVTKAAIIALAVAGHPLVWAAVLADVGTCLVVILNSMFLLRGTTASRHTKKHSHEHKRCRSSHNHEKCSSGSHKCEPGNRPPKKCSDEGNGRGCCGHDDNVHEAKHSVQETEDAHGCCARDDVAVQQMKHTVQETEDVHGCCAHHHDDDGGDHIHEGSESVQETEANHGCCAHEDHVRDVTHCIQQGINDDCCAAHDGSAVDCCAHDDDDDEVHEVKHVLQAAESKHGCCGPALDAAAKRPAEEHECKKMSKDLGSQGVNSNPHCHPNVHRHSDHRHHHHHHHHGGTKAYITEEELGKMVTDCCKNHVGLKRRHVGGCCKSFRKECCGHQHFGLGGLSEIVIE